MLILSRKRNQSICIGDSIRIMVVDVRSNGTVRLGIAAPDDVEVHRDEVFAAIQAERHWLPPEETAAAADRPAIQGDAHD